MKKTVLLILLSAVAVCGMAQKKDFDYKIYGQIRADLFYNSRANEESVDGLFYNYPKDYNWDATGEDLNAQANGNMYMLYTRLGLDVKGPKLGNAATTAKIEFDFRGSGSTLSVVRLRHAYLNLNWGKSSVLVGQTWNPLYGDVAPQILNLNMGAPFQPFGRAPQVRYRYNAKGVQVTVAALWQSQYLSNGPEGKSNKYIKNSLVPEFYIGVDHKTSNFLVGAGVDVLSLVPRTQSVIEKVEEGKDTPKSYTYKVDERVTSLSYEVHMKYTSPMWYVAAKSVLGSNLTQVSMLGGYGVKSVDEVTGEQKYSLNRNSSSWVNVVYGKKWKAGVFAGYMKNLGTGDAVTKMYGTGTNVDRIASGTLELTYNLPHWKIGVEYNYTKAWYGDLNGENGKIVNTHGVGNNRFVASVLYMF
ncbi:MAG: hypothetical protein IJ328_06260 [Muribaculaceae bacterium]|nr:hypothetical protein [Muribaculaceae bacterium]